MDTLPSTIFALVKQGLTNFRRNTLHMFDDMTLKNWIRIVAAVGAYLLLRPYLVKLGARLQGLEYEKETPVESSPSVNKGSLNKGKLNINADGLRDEVTVEEDSDIEGEATGADWGKKARRRQRLDVRRILDVEEKRLWADDKADERVKDMLIDYDEDEWVGAGFGTGTGTKKSTTSTGTI